MAYSLKQLNDAIRSDPAAYAAECDAAFAKKVEAAGSLRMASFNCFRE